MTLHDQLLALADRLSAAGQKEDVVIVCSAICQLALLPEPRMETLEQPIQGFFVHRRLY